MYPRSERLPRDDGAARGRQPDPERDQDEQRLEIAPQHALGSAERAANLDDPDDSVSVDDWHRQDPHLFAVARDRIALCEAAEDDGSRRSRVIVSKVLMPRRALA